MILGNYGIGPELALHPHPLQASDSIERHLLSSARLPLKEDRTISGSLDVNLFQSENNLEFRREGA